MAVFEAVEAGCTLYYKSSGDFSDKNELVKARCSLICGPGHKGRVGTILFNYLYFNQSSTYIQSNFELFCSYFLKSATGEAI